MSRVRFCGCIEGSVTVRPGETPDTAVQRAERQLLNLLSRSARSLSQINDSTNSGPNVGLELNDTE